MDDEGRDGPRNVGLLAIQPADAADSPRIIWVQYIIFMATGNPGLCTKHTFYCLAFGVRVAQSIEP